MKRNIFSSRYEEQEYTRDCQICPPDGQICSDVKPPQGRSPSRSAMPSRGETRGVEQATEDVDHENEPQAVSRTETQQINRSAPEHGACHATLTESSLRDRGDSRHSTMALNGHPTQEHSSVRPAIEHEQGNRARLTLASSDHRESFSKFNRSTRNGPTPGTFLGPPISPPTDFSHSFRTCQDRFERKFTPHP